MSSATVPTSPPDGRRAGAAWVAGTGAFLLLASASVFIAVRWDQVLEAGKLALVVALTGAFLAGGRALRRTLPATGDVLFHLGALLLPVDVTALGLHLQVGWRALLLSIGVVATGTYAALAAATGSAVLRRAATGSVVALAGGIAACTALPGPLVLAVTATAAGLLGRRRPATTWAALAGLSPVAGVVVVAALRAGRGSGAGVLVELGLGGRAAAAAALASGALAAVVLGREAARRHDLTLVALAGACLTTGAATTWVSVAPPRNVSLLAGPSLLVLVEVAALLWASDRFWGRPARAVAAGAELVAATVATPLALALLVVAPLLDGGFGLLEVRWTPQPAAALAWSLLGGAALLAAWRRQGQGGWPAGPGPDPAGLVRALRRAVADARTVGFLTLALGAGLVRGTGSSLAVAAGLVAVALVLVAALGGLGARRWPAAAAVTAVAAWAPVVAGPSHPRAALPVGLTAAAVLGVAALACRRDLRGRAAAALGAAAGGVAFGACAIAGSRIGLPVAMLTSVAVSWGLAALLERAAPAAGHVVRATMALGVLGALTGTSGEVLAVAALATVLFAVDAARHREPIIGLGASLTIPLVVGPACDAAGLARPSTGLVLCVTAAGFASLAVPLPARWRLPPVVAAAVALVAGFLLAAADPARLADCLLLTGGLAVGAGVLARNGVLGHLGGVITLAALALRLDLGSVTAAEAIAAPVAVQLLVAGWQLRRRPGPPSSWAAYGPAVVLLGGTALAERLAGGAAWHSLVAGAVGVAAVAAGGWLRLAGPLLLGTALVAAVTVVESLTTLAGLPTWAWLAVGGTTLLATGLALERSATSPVEAGRRLVDVVGQRFS